MTRHPAARRAATLVESAFVLSVLFFLLLAVVVGGYGVLRYQQLAMLAREGARYASVHGGLYAQETGNPPVTPDQVYRNAILPYAVNLDPAQLSYTVTWDTDDMPYHMTGDYEKPVANTVTVKVSYAWFPEAYLIGPITLTSTSTMTMSY
ncbi:MAG TPA: TadE/TadG family type IV pilus assembly protein [Gemmataceae bacterium]|jgi:Flp pilus assembly protein TadG|nr:TadE/TadG family type IV pilus assembly protein [Gemmataceae bacterium]